MADTLSSEETWTLQGVGRIAEDDWAPLESLEAWWRTERNGDMDQFGAILDALVDKGWISIEWLQQPIGVTLLPEPAESSN